MKKYRISFVITGLGTGGAEMMLYKLLSGLNRDIFEPKVVSMLEVDSLRDKFARIDVPVEILGMKPGIPDPRGLVKLIQRFRKEKPDLVQTWMYHANLLGGLVAKLVGNIPVVWNIRHSNLDPQVDKLTTIWTVKVCGRLSSVIPRKIICCAEVAREIHVNLGYEARKMVVIPNGFDLSRFNPDVETKERVKQELRIPPDSVVIGLVARYHPQKDHRSFFEAAALFRNHVAGAHFILCGDGVSFENPEIRQAVEGMNFDGSLHLLGPRKDIPAITAAFDIATSSSCCGEAFSNTIGEAMACGVPAVVTDVGDSAYIVGDTGRIVPPGRPLELCRAWRDIWDLGPDERLRLGNLARQRVRDHFSLNVIVEKYEKLYSDILHFEQ